MGEFIFEIVHNLLFYVILAVIQMFLCKLRLQRNKWFDFVLPFASFLSSVFIVFELNNYIRAPIPVITRETFIFVRPVIYVKAYSISFCGIFSTEYPNYSLFVHSLEYSRQDWAFYAEK